MNEDNIIEVIKLKKREEKNLIAEWLRLKGNHSLSIPLKKFLKSIYENELGCKVRIVEVNKDTWVVVKLDEENQF